MNPYIYSILCVVNPRSVWGLSGSKSTLPHQSCALGIFKHHMTLHTYVWATCTQWLSSGTPSRGYRRQASLFCGAACGTSMHDFDPTNKRGYTTKVVILLGQSYNTPWWDAPSHRLKVCGGHSTTLYLMNLHGVGDARLICDAHVPHQICDLVI